MPRFFVPSHLIDSNFLVLTGEAAQHAKVLRLKNGEEVTVCDGDGTNYRCTISDVSNGQISLVIHSADLSQAEPRVKVRVYMAFPKADKLEHVIQKATELGAHEIVAFPSSRCISRPDAKSLSKKLARWKKIAASAAEQSGRGIIPTVRAVDSYRQALTEASQADLPVAFYENEASLTFHDVIEASPFATAALITGPEGGFEPEEMELARQLDIHICTLGRRILRCETAPLCALSALMYASGEF